MCLLSLALSSDNLALTVEVKRNVEIVADQTGVHERACLCFLSMGLDPEKFVG